MQTVKVVSVKAAGYYNSGEAKGNTVTVALKRGEDFAICEGILTWEDSMADDDMFDEWVDCAVRGEEGYTATIVEGDVTVLY